MKEFKRNEKKIIKEKKIYENWEGCTSNVINIKAPFLHENVKNMKKNSNSKKILSQISDERGKVIVCRWYENWWNKNLINYK